MQWITVCALLAGASPLPPEEVLDAEPRRGAQASEADARTAVLFVGDPVASEEHRRFVAVARRIASEVGTPLVSVERDGAAWALAHLEPDVALVVVPPDLLDAGLHRGLLLAVRAFDADPFVDAELGYLTASDPDALAAAWDRSEEVRTNGPSSKKWIEGFVTSGMASTVYAERIHGLARVAGFHGHGLAFACVESDPNVLTFVDERLPDVDGCAVLSLTGNGDPQGVWLFDGRRNLDRSLHRPYAAERVGDDPDGAMPRILADRWRERDLAGAIVWSGTCHSAVCERAWVEGDIVSTFGRVEAPTLHRLERDESLGLAFLDAGAVALLAPIGANHGMAVDREQRFAFTTGESLGAVIKSTYDDLVVANGAFPALGVPDGTPANMAAWEREPIMAGGGANRILIGDPRLRPFDAVASPTESVRAAWDEQRERLVVEVAWSTGFHAAAWDMYGTRRDADWRVVARVEVDPQRFPIDARLEVTAFEAAHPESGDPLPYAAARALVEHHRGRAFVHLVANAPRETTAYQGVDARFEVRVLR